MKALLQRVSSAAVDTPTGRIAQIGEGLLVFVAFLKGDGRSQVAGLVGRILRWRLFSDAEGRMGESLMDRPSSGILAVPQFTLSAPGHKGSRPDFSASLAPDQARVLFQLFVDELGIQSGRAVEAGEFAACMQVSLCNEGPVTFLLEET